MNTKQILFIVGAIALFASSAQAYWNSCGETYTESQGYQRTDFYGQVPTSRPGLASITLIATRKKTNIQRVVAFDSRNGWGRDLTWEFQRQVACEGIRGRICNGESVTVCVNPWDNIRSVSFQTEGSNSGLFEIRYGYR